MTAVTSAVLLLLLLAGVWVGARQVSDLRRLADEAVVDAHDRVAVVIPARNEAGTLSGLLASPGMADDAIRQIVVVDDGSVDGTRRIASAHGARVVTVDEVPPGWTGKAWACQLGADVTRAPMLLFLDADTELATDAVGHLLAARQRYGGLVSVQPYHEVRAPYEQLSAYFNVMSAMGSGQFARRGSEHPMAFGPCLMTSRRDYERVGGHRLVRDAILDDVELAAGYARAGLPVRCFVGATGLRMRMYPGGLRQLVEGWTKNIAAGAGQAQPRAAAAAAAWVSCHFAVAVGLLLTIATTVTGVSLPAAGPWFVWVIGWVVLSCHFGALLRRIGSFRWWTWVLFPVPLLAFGLLFVRSVYLTHVRHAVRWRGRVVPVGGPPERPDGADA